MRRRAKNPVPPSSEVQKREAGRLYKNFTGHDPEIIGKFDIPDFSGVVMAIGELDYVGYTTVRDGVTESYHHDFSRKARPLLCVTSDGRQLIILGGEYDFTERGIVDRKT